MKLTWFSGSPFARMARVLIAEWSLPVEPVEHSFPAPLRNDGSSLLSPLVEDLAGRDSFTRTVPRPWSYE